MADEQDLPPDEVAEDAVAAPEEQDTNVNDAAPENPVEALAREMGWAPQEDFRGDPDKWKPADEFIRAGRDIQRTLSDRLKSIESQTQTFGRIAEQLANDKVAERDRYWQQQLDKAVDDGDHELKAQAIAELRKTERPTQQVTPPETQDFLQRNPWMNTDKEAASWAANRAEELARQGLGPARQLAVVEREAKSLFPEHFKQPAKAPPATQTAQSRPAAPSNRAKGFADMPAESQKMARDMVDRNPGLTLEQIATSFWADKAQQARRA